MASLKGSFADADLPSLLQLLALSKRSGVLQVILGRRQGQIYFTGGAVIHAILDQMKGVEAIYTVCGWTDGSFEFLSGARSPENTISMTYENIIMEAVRRSDELEHIKAKIPSIHTVFGLASSLSEHAKEIKLKPDEWKVMVTINGKRETWEIAEEAGFGEFETMKILYSLLLIGLIEPMALPSPESAAVEAKHPSTPPIPTKTTLEPSPSWPQQMQPASALPAQSFSADSTSSRSPLPRPTPLPASSSPSSPRGTPEPAGHDTSQPASQKPAQGGFGIRGFLDSIEGSFGQVGTEHVKSRLPKSESARVGYFLNLLADEFKNTQRYHPPLAGPTLQQRFLLATDSQGNPFISELKIDENHLDIQSLEGQHFPLPSVLPLFREVAHLIWKDAAIAYGAAAATRGFTNSLSSVFSPQADHYLWEVLMIEF